MNQPTTPVPPGHPLKEAWDEYQQSGEYENSIHWLRVGGLPPERDPAGELWAAFLAGWKAAGGEMP